MIVDGKSSALPRFSTYPIADARTTFDGPRVKTRVPRALLCRLPMFTCNGDVAELTFDMDIYRRDPSYKREMLALVHVCRGTGVQKCTVRVVSKGRSRVMGEGMPLNDAEDCIAAVCQILDEITVGT